MKTLLLICTLFLASAAFADNACVNVTPNGQGNWSVRNCGSELVIAILAQPEGESLYGSQVVLYPGQSQSVGDSTMQYKIWACTDGRVPIDDLQHSSPEWNSTMVSCHRGPGSR